ncbi:hypothetical protein K431DRAFT_115749 [Polychaeton citri CBS 116435]|uniref:Uncharacterized protein n=1 Tax=Polychaeton citri CBS 116435 TaxID=1314669 RepID=A0A9P4USF0_9PEZI|nr:hypothetical protein K431DRAFT_115749 [Polychaeton citri CBS 116435]
MLISLIFIGVTTSESLSRLSTLYRPREPLKPKTMRYLTRRYQHPNTRLCWCRHSLCKRSTCKRSECYEYICKLHLMTFSRWRKY